VVDYKEKKKWKFMQKYWHKGAYYQTGADDQFQEKDTDGIFARDFSAPTGEDKFDKTILPKVMQARFELSGAACIVCNTSWSYRTQGPVLTHGGIRLACTCYHDKQLGALGCVVRGAYRQDAELLPGASCVGQELWPARSHEVHASGGPGYDSL